MLGLYRSPQLPLPAHPQSLAPSLHPTGDAIEEITRPIALDNLMNRARNNVKTNTRHGVRFFYRITLGLPDPHFYVPGAKEPSTLPQILSHDELVRVFTVTTNLKHRALLMTAYAAGLRASELGRLQLANIDSARMCLRIDQGKGNKDRYVPLSPRLLEQLRAYWRRERPAPWLFPGRPADRPMSRAGPAHIYHLAKDKAGIHKAGGIHTLRQNYATGLLEAGVELPVIQRRLGHNSIRSTMRYLHLAQDKTSATPFPLDLLDFPRTSRP